MVTIDFTKAIQDAKGASYEALPIGDYNVEIVQADAVRASSGKPMIKVQAKVLQGPFTERRIFNNFVLSTENPQAMAIFFRHMRCFGLDENFFAQLGSTGSLEPVATSLVTRRARWTLGIRQWQGEDRNEVSQVKPYTGAPALAGPGNPVTSPGPVPPLPVTTPVAAPVPPLVHPVAPPALPPVVQLVTPVQPATPATPIAVQITAPSTSTPVIEAAPFDGTTGPTAVPTVAGSVVPSTNQSTQVTSSPVPPPPSMAPELPI